MLPGHIPLGKVKGRIRPGIEFREVPMGPEYPEGSSSGSFLAIYQETRCIPALPDHVSDEFSQCFSCLSLGGRAYFVMTVV